MFAWLLLCSLLSIAAADLDVLDNDVKYNDGGYGPYVTQSYFSSDVSSPRINFMKPFTGCDDGSYLFVSPRGGKATSRPFILDARGHLVWTAEHHYGEVYNFQTQVYRGEQYLTFFAGDDTVGGHGAGTYYMIDQHYQEYRQIRAANGMEGDLHEFQIIEGKTALITAYQVVQAGLNDIGREDQEGYIWDSLFQEIDIDTGEALFEWRASNHVKLSESFDPMDSRGSRNDPWDFFHINSVDKDQEGNYLVSSRYLRSILYISGTTGEILWHLGGKKNSFTDLSGDGEDALHFVGQHHARWADNYTSITFFDNRADWSSATDVKSTGTKILVDAVSKTVVMDRVFANPIHDILSVSQGSLQTLPNGNVLVGYGFNAVMTEFTPQGEVLCDAYIGEPSSGFGTGDVQSYRNFKFNWTGLPNTNPSLRLVNGSFRTSWLGSTEVRSWSLRHAFTEEGTYYDLDTFVKDGFETNLEILAEQRLGRHVIVVALDRNGKELASSNMVDITQDDEFWTSHGILEVATASYDDDYHTSEIGDTDLGLEWLTMRDSMILSFLGFTVSLTGILLVFVSARWKHKQPQTLDVEECWCHRREPNPRARGLSVISLFLSSLIKRQRDEQEEIALLPACAIESDSSFDDDQCLARRQ